MGNKPLIAAVNYFDYTLYRNFLLTSAGDDIPGHEAWHVGNNLRDMGGSNYYTSAGITLRTLNLDTQAPNIASILIVDRGHNLAGTVVQLYGGSNTNPSTYTNILNSTLPSVPGGLPTDSGNGCLTPEGVWWVTFPAQAWRYWQVNFTGIAALGLAPIVTNICLAPYYRFTQYQTSPGADSYRTQVKYRANKMSRGGVRAKTRPLPFSILNLKNYQLDGADYAGFDAQTRPLINYNHPWWYCRDDTDPVAASLMKPYQTPGDFEYDPNLNPVHREVDLLLEETVPKTYV